MSKFADVVVMLSYILLLAYFGTRLLKIWEDK